MAKERKTIKEKTNNLVEVLNSLDTNLDVVPVEVSKLKEIASDLDYLLVVIDNQAYTIGKLNNDIYKQMQVNIKGINIYA